MPFYAARYILDPAGRTVLHLYGGLAGVIQAASLAPKGADLGLTWYAPTMQQARRLAARHAGADGLSLRINRFHASGWRTRHMHASGYVEQRHREVAETIVATAISKVAGALGIAGMAFAGVPVRFGPGEPLDTAELRFVADRRLLTQNQEHARAELQHLEAMGFAGDASARPLAFDGMVIHEEVGHCTLEELDASLARYRQLVSRP